MSLHSAATMPETERKVDGIPASRERQITLPFPPPMVFPSVAQAAPESSAIHDATGSRASMPPISGIVTRLPGPSDPSNRDTMPSSPASTTTEARRPLSRPVIAAQLIIAATLGAALAFAVARREPGDARTLPANSSAPGPNRDFQLSPRTTELPALNDVTPSGSSLSPSAGVETPAIDARTIRGGKPVNGVDEKRTSKHRARRSKGSAQSAKSDPEMAGPAEKEALEHLGEPPDGQGALPGTSPPPYEWSVQRAAHAATPAAASASASNVVIEPSETATVNTSGESHASDDQGSWR